MRTYSPKPGDVTHEWHVIDATDVVLGRLASQAAQLIRGKHKPIYAPHADTGDFVVIVNASKVALVHLVIRLREQGFVLFDIQMLTPITRQFGAVEIPRADYLARLAIAVAKPRVAWGPR